MAVYQASILQLKRTVQTYASVVRAVPLKDIQAVYPWIEPMRQAYPDLPFYWFALQPQSLGLAGCWECDCCFKATLMEIRKRHDPLYPWGGGGEDDGFGYDDGEED